MCGLKRRDRCNRLVVNSDNMEVIDTMKNEGHSAAAATTVFDDCYFLAGDFPLLGSNIVIGKLIR